MANREAFEDVAKRITDASHLTGEFRLRSGVISDHYFDKYAFESDPELLRDICELLEPHIPEHTEVLVGMELGGVPIATVLAQRTGLPLALARKEPKTYGTARQIEGLDVRDKRLLVVEDVITSGGAVADSIDVLRGLGAHVSDALCVINRGIECPPLLAERNVRLSALYTEEMLSRFL